MFIQTEETPNPSTLKFIPGVQVLKEGTLEFKDKVSAKSSNLASLIFSVNGVERVFLATEFVSVTKSSKNNWEIIKPLILTAIMDHYASGKEVIEKNQNNTDETTDEDTEVVKQIKELIPHSRWAVLHQKAEIELEYVATTLYNDDRWVVYPWEETV